MDGIPDHLCLQPVEREPPVVIVVGIDGTGLGEFRPSVRCHLVGLGGDHESVHVLHAVATADKFRGQPIQKIPMQGQGGSECRNRWVVCAIPSRNATATND